MLYGSVCKTLVDAALTISSCVLPCRDAISANDRDGRSQLHSLVNFHTNHCAESSVARLGMQVSSGGGWILYLCGVFGFEMYVSISYWSYAALIEATLEPTTTVV